MNGAFLKSVRTLLILGRVSNLPTVWSNCLAAWWLGGDHTSGQLPFLFAGATFMYVGGMFLNDACDAEFDRQFRAERPIPSGQITRTAVWAWGLGWLALGLVCLFCISRTTGTVGLFLMLSILLYDATHKQISLAPVLMGSCRFVLYLAAASSAEQQVTGWAVWAGLVMGAYVIGLSCYARFESMQGPLRYWPLVLLAAPVVLAVILNQGAYRPSALLLSAVLVLWCLKAIRHTFSSTERNIGRTVAGLLAGIVLVDWLAVADAPREIGVAFLALFGAALFLQKLVPAT